MLEMKLEHMLYNLVQQVYLSTPYQERNVNKALHFAFDVSLTSYAVGKKYSKYGTRNGLHLVYHALMNSVTVFSAVTESPFSKVKSVQDWKFECSHSCWRDTSAIIDLYFKSAKIINAKRKDDGLKDQAPKDMSQNVFFMGFGNEKVWEFIDVEITKDPTDENNYRKLLKVL